MNKEDLKQQPYNQKLEDMRKETKNKCCENCAYKSTNGLRHCTNIFNCPCHSTPQSPVEDTPVTPIKEKCGHTDEVHMEYGCGCHCMLCDDANYGVVGVSHCPHPIEPSVERYVTIQPPSYLNVSIAEYMVMKEQGILMKVKEIEEEIKAAEEKARREVLEFFRASNSYVARNMALEYAKANGISLQAK